MQLASGLRQMDNRDSHAIEPFALVCNVCQGGPCTCHGSLQPTSSTAAAKSKTADPWIGAILDDRYEVLSLIDTGGMSRVYRARHKALGIIRAVKLIHRESAISDTSLKRFDKEARLIGSLSHINLVACVDYGMAPDGTPYVVMELMEGCTVSQLLNKGERIETKRAVGLFIQMCKGLYHAHKAGILHRDIKPSNLMIIRDQGEGEVVKILDFGIAKIQDATETQKLTRTGEICGSPVYMSPEQGRGMEVNERSDIYSLGCVMYEVLCGRPPFLGDNAIETIMKHINEKPAVIVGYDNHRISPGLEAVVMRCLEKEPARRYKSVDDLRRDLELLFGGDSLMTLQVERAIAAQRWHRIHLTLIGVMMASYFGYSFWCYRWGADSWRLNVENANLVYYDLDAAEQLLQIALNKLPANSVRDRNSAAIFMSWARLYDVRGQKEEAAKYFQESKKNIERYAVKNSGKAEITWLPLLADACDGLAACYLDSGLLKEASAISEQAVEARRKIMLIDQSHNFNFNQRALAHSLERLGAVQLKCTLYDQSLKTFTEAEAIYRKYIGEQLHLSTILELESTAYMHVMKNRVKSLELLRQALSIRLEATKNNIEHPGARQLREQIMKLESQ